MGARIEATAPRRAREEQKIDMLIPVYNVCRVVFRPPCPLGELATSMIILITANRTASWGSYSLIIARVPLINYD